jgi:hypothetical protein
MSRRRASVKAHSGSVLSPQAHCVATEPEETSPAALED